VADVAIVTFNLTNDPDTPNGYQITADSMTPTAGATDQLTIALVDQYGNVEPFSGDKNLTFSGLSTSAAGKVPTVTDKNGTAVKEGKAEYITFSNGVASASLVAYAAETKTLAVTDGTLSSSSTGGAGVSLTVSPAAANAYRITAASTTPTAGATDQLTIELVDQFGNVESSGPNAFSGDKRLTFSGLSTSQTGSVPTVTDKNGTAVKEGKAEYITFSNGVASASLVAYAAETKTLAVTDGTLSSSSTGGSGVSLTISLSPLSASGVNFSATAGAPFSGTVATFTTPDTLDGAAAFTATITWGDGSTSAGVVSGSNGSFAVTGSHTYADPVNETVHVTISNPNTTPNPATTTGTATVTSLGQGVVHGLTGGINFWHSTKGQALLNSFNGGSTATALANWLAATFPNLYGASAGGNDLAGKTNAQVAAYFRTLIHPLGHLAQAETLAVALNVYATTASLGGSAGVAYGFTVSATGLGARSYNVSLFGAAFGVANYTTRNVYELLLAVNNKAVHGVLYNGDTTLQLEAAALFDLLNLAGSIGWSLGP
jgi:hypothetical protein